MDKKIDSTYKNHGRILSFGSGPDADWKVIFSVFSILVILVAIFGIRLFMKFNVSLENSNLQETFMLDEGLIRSTSNFYENRRLDMQTVLQTPETQADPSR